MSPSSKDENEEQKSKPHEKSEKPWHVAQQTLNTENDINQIGLGYVRNDIPEEEPSSHNKLEKNKTLLKNLEPTSKPP